MPPPANREITLLLSRDERLLGNRLERRELEYTRVRRGVYCETAAWLELPPWERYRARVRAVAMTWDAPVFCLESAAALLALPTFGEPRDIHLLDVGGKSRRYADVLVHGSADEPEVTTADGMTITSVVDTTLELCRVLPPAFALATADTALRLLGSAVSLDLSALARSRSSRRGIRRLDWVQERATGSAESSGESVSRAVIEWLGFDPPELQVTFDYEGVEDRVDFYWRDRRVIGESDGYGKYDATDVEGSKNLFIAEKVREDRLRRHEDGFARWDWGDSMRATPLGDKLHRAGLAPSGRRQGAMLASLRHNPRSVDLFPKRASDSKSTGRRPQRDR